MIKAMKKAIVVISMLTLAMLTLAACAGMETRWQHTEIPREEWLVDGAQCKHKARRKAERERDDASSADLSLYEGEDSTINSMMAGANEKKRARDLFAECMRGLGYTPAE
ncbi:MAG: hypothetical protein HN644_12595 [Rhodospirillales bacterium]|jgi:hypothetical protein|nr:hypothetical protein [Rhodospirillales bacterium]MBT4039019.1 hypothetical protein [Rhodospirillales bacterium]MBT4628049.1 hypothetical protein [Rhodospirillales bacterium]MBT5352575.1 hypothetical protein [Rhodospirillales bacterium]MBT5520895.1 hypothetical protein [Rhodospirillales bacterium]